MNIKQTIQRLEENGYTCKRSAWGALEASRLSERVVVYFARRGKTAETPSAFACILSVTFLSAITE